MRRPHLATGWLIVSLLARTALAAPAGGDDEVDITVPAQPAKPPTATTVPAATGAVATAPPPIAAVVPAGAPTPGAVDSRLLQEEIEALRSQLADVERRLSAVPPANTTHAPITNPASLLNPEGPREPGVPLLGNLRLWGYIQVEYQHTDQSADQLSPTGGTLNQDLFMVRRARLRLTGDWSFFSLMLELDGNTVNGPTVDITRAEGSFFYRKDAESIPYIKGTLGLTAMPFGFELQQRENELMFMERTRASQAFFPLKQDPGAVLSGGVDIFRYELAAMASESSAYPNTPVSQPDFLGRLGVEYTKPKFEIAGGISFLWGYGFSPGTGATKNTLQWVDANDNGVVDPGEITGVPGAAARPSSTFQHWGVNADLELGVRSASGWTRIFAEGTIADNLDRVLFIADPVTLGRDEREAAWLAGFTQDIMNYGVVGFRADFYNPDADFTTQQRGLVLVTSQNITTLAPLVGIQLPHRARLVFEYDYVINLLGRNTSGVQIPLQDNDWIIRLQGEL